MDTTIVLVLCEWLVLPSSILNEGCAMCKLLVHHSTLWHQDFYVLLSYSNIQNLKHSGRIFVLKMTLQLKFGYVFIK
jgi:hypothetical protein